jgi:hypothetical protein
MTAYDRAGLTYDEPTILYDGGHLMAAYRAAVLALTPVPVAYWRLGEASGTVAADEMEANDGTYVNAPTLGVAGALAGDVDTAVTLNGTTQHITAGTGAQISGSLTLACWVKRNPPPTSV